MRRIWSSLLLAALPVSSGLAQARDGICRNFVALRHDQCPVQPYSVPLDSPPPIISSPPTTDLETLSEAEQGNATLQVETPETVSIPAESRTDIPDTIHTIHAESISTDEAPGPSSIPDIPSFGEWVEKHVSQAPRAKKAKPQAADNPGYHFTQEQIDEEERGEHKPDDIFAPAVLKTSPQASDAALVVTTDTHHPIPHASSGDDSLDPLIALQDRSNYASIDCSASLIRAASGSKGTSNILSSKKDRYMLTPCNVKNKFVIIELCEEIQIDSLVLANFEFFSSMFKNFRVTAGTAYPESEGTWVDMGMFRASNARGKQVFSLPNLRGFYRYVRIDFLTHYGSEYYCPVSLVSVYGLTQLDAFRRDADREEKLAAAMQADESDDDAADTSIIDVQFETPVQVEAVPPMKSLESIESELWSIMASTFTTEEMASSRLTASPSQTPSASSETPASVAATVSGGSEQHTDETLIAKSSIIASEILKSAKSPEVSIASNEERSSTTFLETSLLDTNQTDNKSSAPTISVTRANPSRNESSTSRQHPPIYHPNPTPQPGESIYGTIMKRLTALEVNQTLALRYIEEQSKMFQQVVSRWDGRMKTNDANHKKQDQVIRRIVLDLQLHKAKLEEEQRTLNSQINYLTNEILFEKRLSIVQMIALVILLVFVALTRGSPSTQFLHIPQPTRFRPFGEANKTRGLASVDMRRANSASSNPSPMGTMIGDIRRYDRRRNISDAHRYSAVPSARRTATKSGRRPSTPGMTPTRHDMLLDTVQRTRPDLQLDITLQRSRTYDESTSPTAIRRKSKLSSSRKSLGSPIAKNGLALHHLHGSISPMALSTPVPASNTDESDAFSKQWLSASSSSETESDLEVSPTPFPRLSLSRTITPGQVRDSIPLPPVQVNGTPRQRPVTPPMASSRDTTPENDHQSIS